MKRRMQIWTVSIAVAAVAACGGKEEDPSTTNPAVAVSAISALGSFEAAQNSGDAATAASQVVLLGAAAGSIIVPADPNGMTPAAVPQSATAVTGTCTCTQTSCTFEACGAEDGSWTIDGTVSRDGDTYTTDLSIALDLLGFMWSWRYEGSVTITDTFIDGSLRGSGQGSYEDDDISVSASWTWSVDFEDITRDESGCPVGGSLHAEVDLNAQGNGQIVSFYATGDVAFGPTCGVAESI